ncbi:MAG: exodeoxyribonuclease VII large subunit, partial [Myxococcales bacterium]|nr:exodeoxyribonuclease VII large subunit [Myxococcales bacterium]
MAQPAEDEPRPRIFTVGELMGGLRGLLEDRVGRLWVVGEVSNFHKARSGHSYFTLKDDEGQIRAALFRNAARRVAFEPEDGLEVVVYGDVTVYEARGDLQIIVRDLEPRGQGALQLAFEQLRRKLDAEGLFDPESKRELPEFPAVIGLVTSPGGAVLHDFLQVTGRRFPGIPILIAPTRVQGEGAEDEIASGIDALGEREEISVIVVARGGGSLEDLMAFNSETVARAVARAPV